MKSIAQNYKTGDLTLEETPLPVMKTSGILVRTHFSLISPGTEGTKVREASLSLLGKARARPDKLKQVMDTLRQQGIRATFQKVMNKLDSLSPLGYSIAGVVIAASPDSGFQVGDRVAGAGAGYANHAEINFIPKNLAVKIPTGVRFEDACYTTLGAIALHSVRQGDLKVGESALVVGLGLVGQLVSQILLATGVKVYGVDLNPKRCQKARENGVMMASADMVVDHSMDAAFLCTHSDENDPLNRALESLRDRGRLVVVGKNKLDLSYETCFSREIDVRFSRSYGPGRYDPTYEEQGIDYPLSYVRWSENRNMQAFLDLLAMGKVNVKNLSDEILDFNDAPAFYERLRQGKAKGLGTLLKYDVSHRQVEENQSPPLRKVMDKINLGVIGAGNYAKSMLIPPLRALDEVVFQMVASSTPLHARDTHLKFGFHQSTCESEQVILTPEIDTVLIATPHQFHADLVIKTIKAGKNVFVEKPLCLNLTELQNIENAVSQNPSCALMVGFNRRFSPIMREIKKILPPQAPRHMIYRVCAGKVDQSHWLNDSLNGSRFVGEAGHFIDVFCYLADSSLTSVQAHRGSDQSFTATFILKDGSTGVLIYTISGSERTPKEYLEVHSKSHSVIMNNFKTLTHHSPKGQKTQRYSGDKGQGVMIKSWINALKNGGDMPISLSGILNVSEFTLKAELSAGVFHEN